MTMPRTLRGRLTFSYTFALAIMLGAFAIVAEVSLERMLVTRTDILIADGVGGFASGLQGELAEHGTPAAAIVDAFREVRFPELHVLLLSDSLTVVARSEIAHDIVDRRRTRDRSGAGAPVHGGAFPLQVATLIDHVRALDADQRANAEFTDDDGHFRVNARPVRLGAQSFLLVGAYPLDELHEVISRARRFFLIVIPLLLVAAALGGQWLARRGLSPLTTMVRRAEQIGETTLHERLPVETPDDELGALATVVNRLLGRLDESFANQRRFMADASHELRTPLAVLQGETDVTLSRTDRTTDEYRASAEVVRAATRRMDRIVHEMFLMSRADAGHIVVRQEPVDLEEVVNDTVRAAREIASRRGVQLELRPLIAAPIKGDADLLGSLVLNLVDNAVRHTPSAGKVTVELAERGPAYEIHVSDTGEGVPTDAQPHIFERFYRADSARSRAEADTTSGAGLGLAIGRWIATAHGGSLELVESYPGHTEFCATLPAERE